MMILFLAVTACGWTAVTTFLRAEMLRKRPRPDITERTYAGNWPMILALDLVALAFIGWAIEMVVSRQTPQPGPFSVAIASSVTSTVILISMIGHNWRQGLLRREGETRAADVADVTAAVEATIPPAIDRAIPQVIKDLAAQPDPWTPGRPGG